MASADGIDTIELASNISHKNAEHSIATKSTSDDDGKLRLNLIFKKNSQINSTPANISVSLTRKNKCKVHRPKCQIKALTFDCVFWYPTLGCKKFKKSRI